MAQQSDPLEYRIHKGNKGKENYKRKKIAEKEAYRRKVEAMLKKYAR